MYRLCSNWRSLQLVFFGILVFVLVNIQTSIAGNNLTQSSSRCESEKNSTSEFPNDIFTEEQRQHGAFLFHIMVSLYFFVIIAFVCNDYFIPSVGCICKDLSLSEDVAGATFMAIATSAPELFVNVIGTFLTETDLGVGTVVGSAVFNTLGVAACGGLAATSAIQLEVYPLARDSVIYMSVIALLTGILWDNIIQWYEAFVLLILYIVYFIFLFSENRIISIAKKVFPQHKKTFSNIDIVTRKDRDIGTYGSYKPNAIAANVEPVSTIDKELQKYDIENVYNRKLSVAPESRTNQNQEKRSNVLCSLPNGALSLLWWLFVWPVNFVLWLTIPDCRIHRKTYPLTFCMCVVWIGISSYIISWMMTICGKTLHVSDAVMGITLLAIGGSMPEACSSIINARRGVGSMSISNALGANTLDILLCLGTPWLIKTLLPPSMDGGPIHIESPSLVYNNAIQILCVVALYLGAATNGFKLNRVFGVICLILYSFFVVFIILNEMNVFKLHENIDC